MEWWREDGAVSDSFALLDVLETLQESGRPYFEFLRRDSLSAGVYHLAAGEPDRQRPHQEDELYYVLAGEGRIDVSGDVTALWPGGVIFVRKGVPHHFFDYPEGLTLLVVFAPPQGSSGG